MNNDVGARASRPPDPHLGWHSRGYLPHFDAGAVVQSVTFRLADSLPREVYEKIKAESSTDEEGFFRIEKTLDACRGACLLREPEIASLVECALLYGDSARYRLLAWSVMPNHVHALVEQIAGSSLSDVMHKWKSFTAHAINKMRGTRGRVWAPDYFDRFVRNADHYRNVLYYIENNAVKARLVARPEEWAFSSASTKGGRDARAPTSSWI